MMQSILYRLHIFEVMFRAWAVLLIVHALMTMEKYDLYTIVALLVKKKLTRPKWRSTSRLPVRMAHW